MLSRKGNCFVHQFPLKKGAYFFLYQGQTFLGHLPSLLLLHTFNKEKPQFHCSAFFELSFIFTALHLAQGRHQCNYPQNVITQNSWQYLNYCVSSYSMLLSNSNHVQVSHFRFILFHYIFLNLRLL
jgi:hypothetical protein